MVELTDTRRDGVVIVAVRGRLVVAKAMRSAGGSLVICCLSPMVREVMEIAGFDKILRLAADRDAALALLE